MKIADYFVKNRTELGQLLKIKMALPKNIEQTIKAEMDLNKSRQTRLYSYFRIWRGKFVEQLFAACKYKKVVHIKEVQRRIEGNAEALVKDNYYSCMGGYQVIWDWKMPSIWCWNPEDNGQWFYVNWNYYKMDSVYLNQVDDVIKYTGYDPKNWRYLPSAWVTIWRHDKQIEMLQKMGYGQYCKSLKFIKMVENKDFRKWLTKNLTEEAKKSTFKRLNSTFILKCYKHNLTIKDEILRERIEDLVSYIQRSVVVNANNIKLDKERLTKYVAARIDDGRFSEGSYIDFISACINLHLDMTDTKNLYPINFQEMHDLYIKQVEAVKNEKCDEAIALVVKKYARTEKSLEGLNFILAKNSLDMINEGEALHHCVGRMGYNIKMAGIDRKKYPIQTLILFVRHDVDTPEYTMEYNPEEKKIVQFYGLNDTKPPQEIWDIAREWLEKVKKLRFREV